MDGFPRLRGACFRAVDDGHGRDGSALQMAPQELLDVDVAVDVSVMEQEGVGGGEQGLGR
jgi:hypothetical protein